MHRDTILQENSKIDVKYHWNSRIKMQIIDVSRFHVQLSLTETLP